MVTIKKESMPKENHRWSLESGLSRRSFGSVGRGSHNKVKNNADDDSSDSDETFNLRSRVFVIGSVFLILLTILPLGNFSLYHYAINRSESKNKHTSSFFFIQLSDPQLGILNGYSQDLKEALDWSREKSLFKLALSHVVRLQPSFLLISGDMQQYYPRNMGKANGVLANHTDVGYRQAKDVRSALEEALAGSSIPVKVLAGNHDVDDAPDLASLNFYHDAWSVTKNNNKLNLTGDHYYSFWQDEVFFIVLNSQFYYDESNLPQGVKERQNNWFRSQLEYVQAIQNDQYSGRRITNVVVLTHIPPFGGSPHEKHGFSNWQESDRDEVLKIATSFDLWPTLWLCGHFHGNGRYYGKSHSGTTKNIEVVISNSVTSPLEWDGVAAHETFSTAKMIEIMSFNEDPNVAFGHYILPDLSRISGGSSKAGLRIVEFFKEDGSYRHKWFSLDDIDAVDMIDDESMRGSTWVDNPWLIAKQQR